MMKLDVMKPTAGANCTAPMKAPLPAGPKSGASGKLAPMGAKPKPA